MSKSKKTTVMDEIIERKHVGGRIAEAKIASRNGVDVGIIAGYIATFQEDTGGIFGMPDRFLPGAFLKSLEEHRERDNRQIRLKDHHGRTIGGFPIETAREDEIGLFGVGEVNLETQLGREAFALAKQRVLTDLSIGFCAVQDRIEDGIRVIAEAIIWDGSIVDEPANRGAVITEVKARDLTVGELEGVLQKGGPFSPEAAALLARRMGVVDTPSDQDYDPGVMRSIVRDLNDARGLV